MWKDVAVHNSVSKADPLIIADLADALVVEYKKRFDKCYKADEGETTHTLLKDEPVFINDSDAWVSR